MLRSHLLPPIAALLLATTALSQTTWTSFEDRKGHAIASNPSGGVLMFGGESVETSGKLRNDTQRLSSNNKKWAASETLLVPLARTEHALAAGLDNSNNDVFVMFGGLRETFAGSPSSTITDDTFVFVGGDWVKIDPPVGASAPSPRTGHAMVTDLVRNKVVLFGGFSGGVPRNDLWEFDPTTNTWTQVIASGQPGSPQQRFDHTMAFDSLRGVVYLFGGSPFQNDTWKYDPTTQTWTDVSQPTRPTGRRKAAMSYLPSFDQVVLFGGENNTLTALTDTWTFDPVSGAWTQASPSSSPPARFEHAMAPDQLGTKAVLLGGTDGNAEALGSTWLWNGISWTEEIPPPSSRTGAAMAYASGDERHVMFGGSSIPGGTDLGDTWELDGLNWAPKTPAPTPTARTDAGLAYDAARGVTVLYGGRAGGACGAPLGDTWEWDGTTWTPKSPTTSPPPAGGVQPVYDAVRGVTWMLVGAEMWRFDGSNWARFAKPAARFAAGAAYDTSRSTLVLFGGAKQSQQNVQELWEWHEPTGAWTEVAPTAATPTGRQYCAMAYDVAQSEVLLTGGLFSSSGGANDLQAWDGTTWTTRDPSGPFSGRFAVGFGYDASRARAVLFGGAASGVGVFGETLEWDATAWTVSTPPTSPSPRTASGMLAFDPVRNTVLLYGGESATQVLAETWEYDGIDWVQHTPANHPGPRNVSHLAADPATGKMLLFGGAKTFATNVSDNETWLWDGTNWQQQFPTTSPPARYAGICVNTGAHVLMGYGHEQGGDYFADLWRWDGQDWHCIDAGESPSVARTNYGAAYDRRRDRVVVFGGRESCGSGAYLNETWEWNGTSWFRRTPANAPSARERCRMAYDAHRSRVVLFGGTNGSNTLSDTWEWDGENWTQRAADAVPGASSGHALSYDAARRVTVLFGAPGTWDYGSERPGETISTETVSTCLSVLGTTPELVPTEWNGPWVGDSIGLDFVDMPPSIPVLLIGFTPLPLPLNLFFLGQPLCELAVSPDVIEPLFPFVPPYESGPLPNDPALEGVSLYAQAAFLDLFGGPLVTSNSLQLTLGSK